MVMATHLGGIVETLEQRDDRRLARPRQADERDGLVAGHVEREALENGHVDSAGVAKLCKNVF